MPANELGFFQKHTEKIALGLGVAVLVGAGATQFLLGQPNAVTIDGKEVGPGEIAEQVRTQVDRLQNKLDASESPIVAFDSPAYTENFAKLYERPIADGPLPAVIAGGGLEGRLAVVDSPDYPTKVLPHPPVATGMVIKTGNGVLADAADGREREQMDALRQIIGDQRPADFPYVSVRGTFPIADYRERLQTAGRTDAERIDESLWSRRMAIAAVYLMRERLDPATGAWSDPKVIRPLPGQFGMLPEDRPQLSREEADRLEQEIAARQEEIRRVPFPRLANGPWTPPDADNRIFTAEELKKKEDLEGDLENLQRQFERLVNPDGDRAGRRSGGRSRPARGGGGDPFGGGDPYGGGGGIGGGDPYGGGGAAPGRSGRERGGGSSARAQREEEKNRQRQEALRVKIQEKQTELNNLLGVDDEGLGAGGEAGGYGGAPYEGGGYGGGYGGVPNGSGAPGGDPFGGDPYGGGIPGGAMAGGPLPTDGPDELRVWAHDLTCKAGETYRYKLVVAVFNPLYRQTRLTRKQLKENYDRVSLGPDPAEIAEAEWSPPVELAPEFFYFATSGNKDEKRAEFDVWTIYNGVWEMGSFPEVPGNEIGGVAATAAPGGVPMRVGKILLDVDAVSSSVAGGSTQIRTLVLDRASGEIEGRMVSDDRRSDQREKLEAEREQQIRQRDGLGGPTASVDGL